MRAVMAALVFYAEDQKDEMIRDSLVAKNRVEHIADAFRCGQKEFGIFDTDFGEHQREEGLEK
jgi:hypothetical protein